MVINIDINETSKHFNSVGQVYFKIKLENNFGVMIKTLETIVLCPMFVCISVQSCFRLSYFVEKTNAMFF